MERHNARGVNLILLLLLGSPFCAPAADVSVRTTRQGDTFRIEASADLAADVQSVWRVLTDYNGLPRFIPGMNSSHVVSRSDNQVIIEQKGEIQLLFFTFPMEVKLAAEEFPYRTITSRAVAGNFKEMRNAYQIEVRGAIVRLRYSGSMTPDFAVPPLIGTMAVRHKVERQFGAMVDEIERRRRQPQSPVTPASQP
jgi:ribosome-associated toxin RatA of RatAB toxin-antitoxin module